MRSEHISCTTPCDVDDKKVQPTSGAFPNNHRLRALRWPKTTTTADEPFISLDVELCPGDPSTFSEDTWTLLAPTKDCVSFLSVPEKLRKRIPRGGVHSCSFPRSQWIAAQSQEGNHIPRAPVVPPQKVSGPPQTPSEKVLGALG